MRRRIEAYGEKFTKIVRVVLRQWIEMIGIDKRRKGNVEFPER